MVPAVANLPSGSSSGVGGTLGGLLNKVSISGGGGGWDSFKMKGGGGGGGGQGELASGVTMPASSAREAAGGGYHRVALDQDGKSSRKSSLASIPSPTTNQARAFPPPLDPRSYTILKEVGDGSFGTVWLADWHSELQLPPGTLPPGPSSRPEYKGKRLVAIKRMKKAFEGGWEECMRLKELKVRSVRLPAREDAS
jgi:hypothetical protein